MRILFPRSVYVGAALGLVGAGVIALSLFSTNASRPGDWKAATGEKMRTTPVDGSAFRYGPEINHGRSDTPVNARAQALKEVSEGAEPIGQRRTTYSGRSQRSGTATFFSRGLQSGH